MNLKRSKLMPVIVVAVVIIGLLAAAWPGLAQGEEPEMPRQAIEFLDNRLHEITTFTQLTSQLTPSAHSPSKPAEITSIWEPYTLSDNGEGASLALDRSGQPHVAYRTPGGGVRYARFTWQDELVLSAGTGGHWTSLVVDGSGLPHIAFDTDNGLSYATYYDHTWHIESVETGNVGAYGSLSLDSSGRPHIGYYDQANGDLKYAHYDSASWHIETIDSAGDVGRIINLRLDSLDQLHSAYCVYDPGQNRCSSLKYATRNANGWLFQIVDGPVYLGHSISMAIDALNRPQIAYVSDFYGSVAKHAVYNAAAWQISSVWHGVTNSDISLALDRNNSPCIVFAADGWVIYALKEAYGFTAYRTGLVTGSGWSLGVDGNNRPHLAHQSNGGVSYRVQAAAMYKWSNFAYASYQSSNYEIFTANGDGVNAVQRTYHNAYDSMPSFNRGANRIAFISNRDGNYEIYSMNADGSNLARLTTTTANEYFPSWSPDGTKIAFYSLRDGNAEIYIMNANGSNQIRLASNSKWDGHPTWSPDGLQLAFASDRSGGDEIWIMNADGSNPHQITFDGYAAYPDWSPDGTRLIYNDDFNHDTWLDMAIINVNGTGLSHPMGAAPINYDYLSPRWAPNGIDVAFSKVQWIFYQGNYYWVDAYITSFETSLGYSNPASWSGTEWWPTWKAADAVSPSILATSDTVWSETADFTVRWGGLDNGPAGVMSYDIQYRDGSTGAWISWFTQSKRTGAIFSGSYGHTYYFRARARDYAYNLGGYSSGDGDIWTTIYQYTTSGQVLDDRDQPVAAVNGQTDPPALNTSVSRHDGLYDLYFASGGVYTLTTTRSNFGQLPPLLNATVPSSNSLPTLYLPPLDNQINDSHFESGDLSGWNLSSELTPTITSTAHTGLGAVVLGGTVPTDTLTTGPWHSTIEQTLNVSPTIVSGTLSLLYRVASAEPLSDTLTAYVIGANDTLTFTLPLTASEWTHAWFDLSAWIEPTATLKIDFALADTGREATLGLDEITWGSAIQGSHIAFLPVARR